MRQPFVRWLALSALASLGLLGCDETPLDRSCGGSEVDLCGPYEYADVSGASMSPDRLPIADFSMEAHIRVEIATCPDAPAPSEVELAAIVPGGEDGSVRVMSLLTLTDGGDGDAATGDGVIDVSVANPFIATVPANTDITLRFTARSTTPGGCTSGAVEIPYRTGPPRE